MRNGKMDSNVLNLDYIEFKDDDEAESWGKKHYNVWSQQYKENMYVAKKVITTSCMSASVECYCGYNYRQINEYLRFGTIENESTLYREMAYTLSIILSMAPRIPDNVIVYRLVCDEFIHKLIQNNKDEIPTQEKGFISTSLTRGIVKSEEFYSSHKNILKIYVKANTVGIYVNCIERRSEQELLLYPNGYFKLLKKPYKENGKIIYECELFYF